MSLVLKSHSDRRDSVDTVETIAPVEFRRRYIRGNQPLLITAAMESWPAMRTWSFDYFRKLAGRRTVHLEVGNVMQEQTGFREQRLDDFIGQLMDDHESSRRQPIERHAYLSVFRIFDDFPELRGDVDFSLIDQFKCKSSTSGWIGPSGTVTGYHIDWGDNILAQIRGRKRVLLASPRDTPNMYVSSKFDQGTSISEVDMDHYDRRKHPLFEKVRHREVILHPGQMLFIPRGWWHHVRSLDRSISVSNLTFDLCGIVRDVFPHRVKQILHNRGLWPCECTCHLIRDGRRVTK